MDVTETSIALRFPAPKLVQMCEVSNSYKSLSTCSGFTWQGFGSGGATRVASVRSCKKLPSCLIKPVPASSKTDPPLAKAKPSSDDGSASGIADLRSGKKNTGVEQQSGERSEMM